MTKPEPLTPNSSKCATTFTADWSALEIVSGRTNLLDAWPREKIEKALHDWTFWARADQSPPTDDAWTTWLILGGRGAGKTRAGAEWILAQVRAGARRIALIGETYADVREVMISGPSGLRQIGHPAERPRYAPSRRRVQFPNGAEAYAFSAEEPEGLRGHQFDAAWADELCKWPHASLAWDNLQLGLRLGDRPRQVVTTTPRPMPLLRQIMERADTRTSRATTFDNKAHLADAFLTQITSTYVGTRLGQQELMGELIADRPGALWNWDMIETARVRTHPRLSRIVVAVDPPVTSGADADTCGIVVVGIAVTTDALPTAYVLEDASADGLSPLGWATRVSEVAARHGADRVVAEVNQGGELVLAILRQVDPAMPVHCVRASRGKIARAEPVAAFYEQGRVRHVGTFPLLESQLTAFTGDPSEGSPDRLDALVWAISELMTAGAGRGPSIRTL